jgi:hypothetical protein
VPLRESLGDSRSTLDLAVRLVALSAVFGLVGSILEGYYFDWTRGVLVLVATAVVVLLSHQWAIQTAKVYSDLIRASFDLHRFDLYKSLHLDYPSHSGEEERKQGEKVSEFLWRGTVEAHYCHSTGSRDENN